jgi:hypothetical protein
MAEKDDRKFVSKMVRSVILGAEAEFKARAITYQEDSFDPKSKHQPGGMCSCCGADGHITDEHDW